MINIKEEKLRAAIQIILGSEDLHNDKLEKDLVYAVKALATPVVSRSLPISKPEDNIGVNNPNWYKIDGKYHHLISTYDGTYEKLFVDGDLVKKVKR